MRTQGLTLLQMLVSIVIVSLVMAILVPVIAVSHTPDPQEIAAAQLAPAVVVDEVDGSVTSDLPPGSVYSKVPVKRTPAKIVQVGLRASVL